MTPGCHYGVQDNDAVHQSQEICSSNVVQIKFLITITISDSYKTVKKYLNENERS